MNTDFNLFGAIGIRLVNPSEKNINSVSRLVGVNPSEIKGEPDITITFTDEIHSENLTYAGLDAGFDKNNFYIFKQNKKHSKVIIPFDKIGNSCKIICEKDIDDIPLLNYIIYLSFLSKRWIAVHSSSFVYNGEGILVMGWTKGGKTETLLSFLNNGAQFVSDEWTIISENGKSLHGLPVTICIWEWYFDDVKNILPKIKLQKKIIFRFIHIIQNIYKLALKLNLHKSELLKILQRVVERSEKNLNIRVLPKNLVNVRIAENTAALNKIILSVSSQISEMTVKKISVQEVIERMIHSNREEYNNLFVYYNAFRFAFPDRKNELLEKFDEIHRKIFNYCFTGKNVYKIVHTYPVPINQLFTIVNKIFDQN